MTPDFANTQFQVEQIVGDCWREVLGLTAVDAGRNFFDVGGTSVHAILLHAKLRERLPSYDFSVMTIFKHPSIAEFLEAIAAQPGTAAATPRSGITSAPTKTPAANAGAAPMMTARERAQQQQLSAGTRPPWAGARG